LKRGRKPLIEEVEQRMQGQAHPVKQVGMALYRRGSGMKSIGLRYMDDDLIRRAIGDASTDPHRIKTIADWAKSTEDLVPTAKAILDAIVDHR
ncbi:hypothetical protein R0K19_22970, partial [Bacillus sp. SIMBA_161]